MLISEKGQVVYELNDEHLLWDIINHLNYLNNKLQG